MNTIKTFLFAFCIFSIAGIARAANESPGKIGPTASQLGAVHTSSGTNPTYQTRRVSVDNIGSLHTIGGLMEVIRSTGNSPVGNFGVGNDTSSFAVNASSWVGSSGSGSRAYNLNVARLASLSSPVYVDKVIWASIVGEPIHPGKTRVILYDSQGSTSAAVERFNQLNSSSTWSPVELWFSSGVTVRKIGVGDVQIHVSKQNR